MINHINRAIKIISVLLPASLILSGCAAVIKMTPIISDTEKSDCIFIEGEAYVRSGLRDTVIITSMKKNLEGYLQLTIGYVGKLPSESAK